MLAAFLTLALAVGVSASPIDSLEKRLDISSPGILGFAVPPTRGFSYAQASQGPCGGFPGNGNHTYFGLLADFYVKVANDVSNVKLSYSTKEDMSNPVLIGEIDRATSGYICLDDPIDWRAAGLSMQDEVTLQLSYYDEVTKRDMFNCADIHLTSDHAYAPVMNFTCSNSSFITTAREAKTSNASPVHRAPGQSVSPLGSGFIGAAVMFVVMLAIAGLLKLTNVLSFSRPGRRAPAKNQSSRVNHDHDSVDEVSTQHSSSVRKEPL